MVEIKNTGITGVCIDIMTSSYPMVKKQLNMGKYKRKKCDELHGSPESSISVCNPPLPLVAKSKALTPTKKNPFSLTTWSTQQLFSSARLMFLNMQCYATPCWTVLCTRWFTQKYHSLCTKSHISLSCKTQKEISDRMKLISIASWSIQWKCMLTETNILCCTHKKSQVFEAKWGWADNRH